MKQKKSQTAKETMEASCSINQNYLLFLSLEGMKSLPLPEDGLPHYSREEKWSLKGGKTTVTTAQNITRNTRIEKKAQTIHTIS